MLCSSPRWSGLRPGPRSWGYSRSRSSAWAWRCLQRPPGGEDRTHHTCRPRPARSSSSRADGDCPAPSERAQSRQKASRRGAMTGDNCAAGFACVGQIVNYYNPPGDGFVLADEKAFALEAYLACIPQLGI